MVKNKFVSLNARSTRADAKPITKDKHGALRDTIEIEKQSNYYAVCTNMWSVNEEDGIYMCTYTEPLYGCDTYAEAKIVIDEKYNGAKKCPYCGHSHFRAKDYESLVFDNDYANTYFHLNQK